MLRPSKRKSSRKPRTERVAEASRARRPARKSPNRRSVPDKPGAKPRRPPRPPLSPAERKARNRTVLLMSVLALVNAYVFLWRGEGALASFLGGAPSAVIGGHDGGPLPPVADPPAHACTGDPVRILEGLHDLVHLEASLSRGLTLRLALLQLGIEGTEIDGIEAGIRSHVDLSLLGGSGAPLRVAMDRLGGVRALEIELAEGHALQACRDGDAAEGWRVRNIQHPLRSDVEVVALKLGDDADLGAAVEAAGEKPELARRIAAELAHDVDFMTEARPEDELTVVVEKRWLGKSFHRYGAILALRFHGVAARVEYFRYKPEGMATAFFDAKGQPVRRALLRSPVGWFPVEAEARGMLPPSLEVVEGRVGAAYRLPEGAPVVAVGDGVVVESDRDGERGLYLDVELRDGTRIRSMHLLRTMGLEVGTDVRQGQVIALAGHSGRTPHDRLRLEIWQPVDGELATVDPMRLLAKGSARAARVGEPIPPAQLDRYEDDVAPRQRALRVVHRGG